MIRSPRRAWLRQAAGLSCAGLWPFAAQANPATTPITGDASMAAGQAGATGAGGASTPAPTTGDAGAAQTAAPSPAAPSPAASSPAAPSPAASSPAAPSSTAPSSAAPWPGGRPTHLVIPWPPGGETDRYGRALADALAAVTGQPVVVENRAGATGAIGIGQVVRSPADGHTLLFANTTAVVGNVVSSTVPVGFDPVTDLKPIALTVESSYVLWANPALGVATVDALVERARDTTKPPLAFGITGPGSLSELSVEQLARHYGLALTKVPYKGSAPQLADLVAGHTQIGTADPAVALPQYRDGRLVPLLVIGRDRLPELPGVPALSELRIPGPDLTIWNGLFAPSGTPPAVIAALTAAVAAAGRRDSYLAIINGPGRRAIFEPGDVAASRISRELDERRRYQAVIDGRG